MQNPITNRLELSNNPTFTRPPHSSTSTSSSNNSRHWRTAWMTWYRWTIAPIPASTWRTSIPWIRTPGHYPPWARHSERSRARCPLASIAAWWPLAQPEVAAVTIHCIHTSPQNIWPRWPLWRDDRLHCPQWLHHRSRSSATPSPVSRTTTSSCSASTDWTSSRWMPRRRRSSSI